MRRLREFKTSWGYSMGRGESRKENSNPHSTNKTDTSKYNKKERLSCDHLFKLIKGVGMTFQCCLEDTARAGSDPWQKR